MAMGMMGPWGPGFGYGAPTMGVGFGGAPGMTFMPMVPAFAPAFGFGPGFAAWGGFGGLGGLRRHGGTYSPQFVATGLPTDEEITEMIYDAMDVDPLIPYDADINVEVDSGVVTLTGTVPNKQVKAAAGDDAWWVPGVVDVRNQLQVVHRHRHRGEHSGEAGEHEGGAR